MLRRCCAPFALAAAALLAAPSALTQSAPEIVGTPSGMHGLAGEPYSATFSTTHHQTLADGTEITHISKTVRCRDSLGRTRFEFYAVAGTANADPVVPIMVTIMDPVSGQIIHLFPRQKTATLTTMHTTSNALVSPPHLPAESTRATAPLPDVSGNPAATHRSTAEDLGYQTIDGLTAHGHRITRIIPAGAQGNDRAITVVSETWMSEDLKIIVQSSTSDPRFGESTTEMQDLSRDEPDPALFQVPPDYTATQQSQAGIER